MAHSALLEVGSSRRFMIHEAYRQRFKARIDECQFYKQEKQETV